MNEHLVINLRVADMRYPLRVKRIEEAVYREAASEIDYKLGQYKEYFTGSSDKPLRQTDYMVMTAIQAVVEKVQQENRANLFENQIKQLTEELEMYLKQFEVLR